MSLSFNLKKDLHTFSMEIGFSAKEEMTVLFGPSGAGKSLLLNMLCGIVRPDEGFIIINENEVYNSIADINIPIRERNMGHLFQEYALFPHMTIYDNIAYGINHLSKNRVKSKVEELLYLMRLSGMENRLPHELSGGQKQRAALARTLATDPKILLLDEPFSALDYQVREKLRQDLLMIHQRYPITTVFVTHDLEEAFVMGEKIAIINNGRLEQFGTREEVFYKPRTKNVAKFLGARNIFSGSIASVHGSTVIIENPDIGKVMALADPETSQFSSGEKVTFGIRPEEIMIIRPDRPIDKRIGDNLLEGEVLSTVGKGGSHTVYFKVKEGESTLKIEIPNFAYKKIDIVKGKQIVVSLKKENIWIIPGTD